MKFGLCIWCDALRWIMYRRNCCWLASLINSAFFSHVFSDNSRGLAKPPPVEHAQVSLACERWPDHEYCVCVCVCCIIGKCTIMYVEQTGNSIHTQIIVLHWLVLPYHSVKSPIAEEEWAWVMGSCYRTPLSWPESIYGLDHHGSNISVTVTITITVAGKVLCLWAGYEHLSFTLWRNKRRLFSGIKWWFGSFWQWFLKKQLPILFLWQAVSSPPFASQVSHCSSFCTGIIAYIRVYFFAGPHALFPVSS